MKILVYTGRGAMLLSLNCIVYCEAESKYTNIYYENKTNNKVEKLFSNMQFTQIEELLPKSNFYRCHKSIILNFDYFFEHDTVKSEITLTRGIKINISRRKKAEFKENLLKYLENYRLL